MMIFPDNFIENHIDDSYEELVVLRDGLIAEIREFEAREISEDISAINPRPDVVYQMNLQYLSVLCKRIAEVYNRDIV